LLQAFDELLLLKRGGQAIYCGPLGAQSAQLIAYFQVFTHTRPVPSHCTRLLLQQQ
jgi:hypothetical protein